MAEKEHWLRNNLVDERMFVQTTDRKKTMHVKHRAEKEEPSNSKVIYIRESSCSPRHIKTKANDPELLAKPGRYNLITDRIAKRERKSASCSPIREIDNIDEKKILAYKRRVKDCGDNPSERNTQLQQNLHVRCKLKSKLTAALVSNCSYIPGADNTYNKYHTAYAEEPKESDCSMTYNCQSALWW